MIRDVLEIILLPPQSKVVVITEPGSLHLVQVHTEVHFGKEELVKFQQALNKEKLLYLSEQV